MEKEVWKDVPNYIGHYKVSNYGNFYGAGNFTLFKRQKNINKYHMVTLRKDGVSTVFAAHIIIAKVFIPNPDSKPVVNHKNGLKNDNRVENLEWVTYKENSQHYQKHLKNKLPRNAEKQSAITIKKETANLLRAHKTNTGVAMSTYVEQAVNEKKQRDKPSKTN